MANVISSIETVQQRLLAAWQTQQAEAKARPQTTSKETSRATTSFQALLSGKATAAPLPVTQKPASALVATALRATQPAAAVATVATALRVTQPAAAVATVAAALPATQPPAAVAAVAAALPATQPAAAVAAVAPADDTPPTAESVFGANPWITDPTGTAPNGSSYGYNPLYFATASTAAQVAQMVGGTVVPSDELANGGGFSQQQPNEMVQLANGTLINAGLVAGFYTHGYSQSNIDQMIVNEVNGV